MAYSGFVVSFFKLSSIYTNPFIRLCEFMIGITIGCIRADYKINLKAGFSGLVFLMSFVILLFGVSIIYNVFSYDDYMQYNWFLIPSSGIMIYYSTFMMDDRYSKVLRYLSNLSYCYFLAQLFSNFIAQLVISRFGVSSNTIKILIGWSICTLIAIAMHHMIERPIQKIISNQCLMYSEKYKKEYIT